MELKNVEIFPAVVVSSSDDTCCGRVKCSSPGRWDTSTMSVASLPWVYPLTMWGYQSYSSLMSGSKVWVINNKDNWDEFWYVPFFELNGTTSSVIGSDSDVVISRSGGTGTVYVYYNGTDGLVMAIGNSKFHVLSNGDVEMLSSDCEVCIRGSHVYTGVAGGTYEAGVLGDTLVSMLREVSSGLQSLASSCQSSMYTLHLFTPILNLKNTVDTYIPDITSKNVSIN